jgi:transcription-repair coupling factor (superfamily II helicase)
LTLRGIDREGLPLLPVLLRELGRKELFWILTATPDKALRLFEEITTAAALLDRTLEGVLFPEEELLPYERESPADFIRAERIHALDRLSNSGNLDFVVAPVTAVMRRTLPPGIVRSRKRSVAIGQETDPQSVIESLLAFGYVRVPQVTAPGEFSVRGSLVDLYSTDRRKPVRIEWEDLLIRSIRLFDPTSQRSVGPVSSVDLLPSHEWLLPETTPGDSPGRTSWLRTHSLLPYPPGIERYLPSFFTEAVSPVFARPDSVVIPDDWTSILGRTQDWAHRIAEGFNNLPDEDRAEIPPPDRAFTTLSTREEWESALPCLTVGGLAESSDRKILGTVHHLVDRGKSWISEIEDRSHQGKLVIFCRTKGQRDRLRDVLEGAGVPVTTRLEERIDPGRRSPVTLLQGDLEDGFEAIQDGVLVLSDTYLFRKTVTRPAFRSFTTGGQIYRRDHPEFREGDYVVHLHQGIGRYRGLKEVSVGTLTGEFCVIEYQGGDRLYVSVDQMDQVLPYQGPEGIEPKLDRLGGKSWNTTRSRVRRQIERVSAELVALYALRKTVQGFAFSPESGLGQEFDQAFPYDLTPDQEEAIRAVSQDMESDTPMDRLILGDVGFGKTEVAMRAAYRAILDGKQVAVLVPTTLLALQHHETFRNRFAGFPVRIESLSRMVPASLQKGIRERVNRGETDIIIGTTAILSTSVTFRDLGLLVIDEEQRFGVRQKEKLTERFPHVDRLTLSATPIPRTLQMALSGLKGISFIMTPPPGRKAIRTAIIPFNRERIREAIDRELAREGQIFFIHNRVSSIGRWARYLENLFPEAGVLVAHGQMDEKEVEEVITRYLRREARILVSTTIVESGLDIPGANTILINRADLFGIAELYQLRGRVGRGGQQAFAYFIARSEQGMTELSKKRLQTLQEHSGLGSGYQIAMRDMEIRGAGSLLGHQQTGQVAMVGLDLYLEMVEEAIAHLTRSPETAPETPPARVEFSAEARLTEDYVDHPSERIDFYRRLAHAGDLEKIDRIEEEIVDRFGPLPRAARNLLAGARMRVLATWTGFSEVSVRDRDVLLKERAGIFSQERLSKAIDLFGDRVGFQSDGTWKVVRTTPALLLEDLKRFKDLTLGTGQIASGSS